MALAARVQNRTPVVHGKPCSIGALLEQLQGDELEAFKLMLGTREKPGWSASEIYDTLIAEGYTVGRQSISRHRGHRCRCDRTSS